MVRLERMMYEKVVNNSLVGRARRITTPKFWKKDWNDENRSINWPFQNLLKNAFIPIMDFYTSVEYNLMYNRTKRQGIPVKTNEVMDESEWRRDILVEQMKRENMHPWTIMEHTNMKNRYFKVNKFMAGHETPDYLVAETHAEGLLENRDMTETIDSLKSQYHKEMMPNVYQHRARFTLLEFTIFHNLFDKKSWNRYFYNEATYTHELDEIEARKKEYTIDFNDPAEQVKFKDWLNKQIKMFPGYFIGEKKEFDFESFFKNNMALNGQLKPDNNLNQEEIDALRTRLQKEKDAYGIFSKASEGVLRQDTDEEVVENVNTVGIKMPERLSGPKYRAWMA